MGCCVCELVEKENDADLIFESDFWTVLLSFNQRYLGRCYIFSKRHFGSMSDMTENEALDFLDVVKKIEGAIKKAFGATMFNWGCLGNHMYKKEIPNPHVTWHMMPRYQDKVLFNGKTFEDGEFGELWSIEKDNIVCSEKMKAAIVKEIQKNL